MSMNEMQPTKVATLRELINEVNDGLYELRAFIDNLFDKGAKEEVSPNLPHQALPNILDELARDLQEALKELRYIRCFLSSDVGAKIT